MPLLITPTHKAPLLPLVLPDYAGAAPAAAAPASPVLPAQLSTACALSSKDLADIVDDKSWRLRDTRDILADKLGVHRPTVAAAEVVREVGMRARAGGQAAGRGAAARSRPRDFVSRAAMRMPQTGVRFFPSALPGKRDTRGLGSLLCRCAR